MVIKSAKIVLKRKIIISVKEKAGVKMGQDMKSFNFKKVLLTFLSIFILFPILSVATDLSGSVKDNSDGSSLVNAIITIIPADGSSSRSMAADVDGNFTFADVVAGTYTVKISYIGFSTWTKSVVVGESDKSVSASLSPSSINMNSITVSASRVPEKIVDAPAAVSLVDGAEIAERATLTTTEHLKGLPGVDVASTGLNQSNVVVRGFNNIFSGTLMVLTDNRIARVPSLRFNAFNFIPTINEDIERIEVVSGPGSALYGPNSANGVMHIITKSPFTSQGSSISVGGGERSVKIFSGRHAGMLGDKIGYKFSGQYYEGDDWEHFEPGEPDSLTLYKRTTTVDGNIDDTVKTLFENKRNFDIQKFGGEGRFDFILGDHTSLIVNGGYNQSTSIELTGLGAGQATDWSYKFAQARLNYKDLFVQAFVNASDAGDTYLLESGQLIVDKSKLWVAQIQHRYEPNEKSSLTYGVDALFTRPNTENTINGRNDDMDNINELGAYVQGDYKLNEKFKFVGAFRVDDNDQLDDMVYSPRAGLVFQPDDNNNFRLTYNRAFTTPDNNNLFLDLLIRDNPFFTGLDLRVQGVPESGFHWNYDNNGDPLFASQYDGFNGLYDINDQTFMNTAWGTNRAVTTGGIQQALAAAGLDAGSIGAISAMVNSVVPATLTDVGNMIMVFDPDLATFVPTTASSIQDIDRMEPTITQTLELGYKGVLNNKFQFSFDAYRTQKDNFVGPLTVENPTIHLNSAELAVELTTAIGTAFAGADGLTQGTLIATFDDVTKGGNGDGTPVDELVALYTAGGAGLPFGSFSPIEQYDPNAVLITYRNFGEITFYGTDLAFAYHINHNWNFGGTYSYVSKNFFPKDADQVHDIHLNAPKNKFGAFVKYTNPSLNLNTQVKLRWVDEFEMASPFFGTTVEQFTLVDLNVGIDLVANTHLSLTVQNIFDNKHTEFVGGAEIGRLAIMRVTQTF